MDPILSPHFTGPPFELFGVSHVWTILALLIAGILIVRTGIVGDAVTRRRLRWFMVAIFLFWEIEWQVWHLITGLWTVQRQLPLHLCSIMIWVAIYGLATEDKRVYPFIYFLGIAGSLQAVLTPDAIFDFPHLRFLNTMISHGLLVITGFWVVFVERYRPTWSDVVVSIVALNLFALVVYPINLLIHANYLYIVDKPPTASLLDFFPEWPWYILILEVLVVAILTTMCWPFNRRPAAESTAVTGH